MEYVYAAMLLHAAEKDMTEDAVTATLAGAGVDVDAARVKALCASLAGVDIADAMTQAVAAPAAAAEPAMDQAVYQQYLQQFMAQGYDEATASQYAQQYALQYAQQQG